MYVIFIYNKIDFIHQEENLFVPLPIAIMLNCHYIMSYFYFAISKIIAKIVFFSFLALEIYTSNFFSS